MLVSGFDGAFQVAHGLFQSVIVTPTLTASTQ